MYLKRLVSIKLPYEIGAVRRISTAYLSNSKEDLIISDKGRNERFPLVWLRDNCRCDKCYHYNSNSRIINWNNFNVSPRVQKIEVAQKHIILKWQDGHTSTFSKDWLKERSFVQKNQKDYLENKYRPNKILWNKDSIANLISRFDYNNVMKNNSTLYKWLMSLARYGVAFLENVPHDESQCRNIANRIAFIRRTHYQEEFDIVKKPGTSNVAYLNDFLQLHTDLPYYDYTPGVTLLHCLVQTDSLGGESLLTDGFYVAEKLREEDKLSFDILKTVEVNWNDVGAEHGDKYHSIYRSPVIRLDSQGNLDRISHSVPQRDSYFTVDINLVTSWYKAMRVFVDSLNNEAYKFKLASGTLMAFDNTRLLHGRVGYEDVGFNQRHLVGCYIDWDEVFSKIRVLEQEERNIKLSTKSTN